VCQPSGTYYEWESTWISNRVYNGFI
jgi:hypothetical protein